MQSKLTNAVKTSDEGTLVYLRVQPNSKEEAITLAEWEPRVNVKVRAPAVGGKANEAVIRLFSELGACKIVSGAKSRKKTLVVDNTADEVLKMLEEKTKQF